MPRHLNLKITVLICLALVFGCGVVKAQKAEEFSFSLPDYKIQNSLYNNIILLDQREDTTYLGFVQKGLSNKKILLTLKTPLQSQIQNILSVLIDDAAKSSELLLQLRKLNFSEVTSTTSERGFFHLNASLYVKQETNYLHLGTVDTVAVLSALDVTNGLLKKGSEIFGDYIAAYLNTPVLPTNAYKYDDVVKNVELLDKKRMKAYYTEAYTDGVYLDYFAFCKQVPNGSILVEGDSIGKNNVKAKLEGKKLKAIKPADVYAIVYNGLPFIATKFGYFPLKKNNGRFSFIGNVPNATTGEVLLAYAAVGVIAGNAITSNINSKFEIDIDKLNGNFIKVKEVTQAENLSGK